MRLIPYSLLKAEKGVQYSQVHIARLVKAGTFPKPVELSSKRKAWIESDVDEWISTLAERRNPTKVKRVSLDDSIAK